MKLGLAFALCLITIPAFGSTGGNCPSSANYLNTTTNTMVTLSSLGITNCYYVAANGSDSNTGADEAHPFLHSPGMQACVGTSGCGAVPWRLAAGTGIIFRGGDTWHFGNSSLTPYSAAKTGCSNNGNVSAGLCLADSNLSSSGTPIYYGVDIGWFHA